MDFPRVLLRELITMHQEHQEHQQHQQHHEHPGVDRAEPDGFPQRHNPFDMHLQLLPKVLNNVRKRFHYPRVHRSKRPRDRPKSPLQKHP